MYFITITESSVLFGICNKESEQLTISRISKNKITASADSSYNEKNIFDNLIDILNTWNKKDTSSNKDLYISIPNKWVNTYINNIDKELNKDELIDVLNWHIKMRYGKKSSNHIIQHYPLQSNPNHPTEKYISISLNKNIKNAMLSLCEEYGYNLKLIDMNLMSAYNILEKTFPISAYNKFGIWQIADKSDVQNLLLINNNELNIIQFKFEPEKSYRIIQNSSIDSFGEKIVKSIVNDIQNIGQLEKLFTYTYFPENDFVKKFLRNNNDLINPFAIIKTQDMEKTDLLKDKISLSQFSDLAGLMSRFGKGE